MYCVIYRVVNYWYVAILGSCRCKRKTCKCKLEQQRTKKRATLFAEQMLEDTGKNGKPVDLEGVSVNDSRIYSVNGFLKVKQ